MYSFFLEIGRVVGRGLWVVSRSVLSSCCLVVLARLVFFCGVGALYLPMYSVLARQVVPYLGRQILVSFLHHHHHHHHRSIKTTHILIDIHFHFLFHFFSFFSCVFQGVIFVRWFVNPYVRGDVSCTYVCMYDPSIRAVHTCIYVLITESSYECT